MVLVGFDDGVMEVWSSSSRTRLRRFKAFESPTGVSAVAYDAVRGNVISSGTNGHLKLWNLADLLAKPERPFGDSQPITAKHDVETGESYVLHIAMQPSAQMIATAEENWLVTLRDPETLEPLGRLTGHRSKVNAVRFVRDDLLVSTDNHSSTKMWMVPPVSTMETLHSVSEGLKSEAMAHRVEDVTDKERDIPGYPKLSDEQKRSALASLAKAEEIVRQILFNISILR